MRRMMLLAVLWLCGVVSAEERGMTVEALGTAVGSLPRYHALVIGINDYSGGWQELRQARLDAQEVAGQLRGTYGFDSVKTLYDRDASRTGIERELRNLAKSLGPGDSLLVYYAGHGYYDKLLQLGYWVPSGARRLIDGEPATLDWIDNELLKRYLDALKARHVLVVSDACFGGSLLRRGGGALEARENAWYRRALAQPSRYAICSGDLETVPDKSLFARKFVETLQYPPQQVFSGEDLAYWIKREVAARDGRQPLYGPVAVDRGSVAGQFVFVKQGHRPRSRRPVALPEPRVLEPLVSQPRRERLRVPSGFRAARGAVAERYTNTGWAQEIVHEKTGIEMVYVPAGSFMMGSPSGEKARDDDERQHRVTLTAGFYLGKYEVTQGQWEAVMGRNPSHFQNAGKNAPVESVSWEDCVSFCGKLGGGFRLPTEAEWEYACRAGTEGAFHYGNSLDASMANFNGNYPYGSGRKGEYRKTTVGVGQFRPNGWGLYDMHGNVWEWCSDWYGNYPSGSVTDPVGPQTGSHRVLRGGSWRTAAPGTAARRPAAGTRRAFASSTAACASLSPPQVQGR